jgi:hypothetical protein
MARRGASVKTLKKMLKSKGLKTTGKKATLTRRAKKAKLMKGGARCQRPGDHTGAITIKSQCQPGDYDMDAGKVVPPSTSWW